MKKNNNQNVYQTLGYVATAPNKTKDTPTSTVKRGDDLRKRGAK